MTSHTEYLTIETPQRYEIRDITGEVERVRATARLNEGFVLVSTMHITSSIFVNDHEPGLWSDILTWVEGLAPAGKDYRHHLTGEDNGDAHRRQTRPRTLGTRSLRRVRRPTPEARPPQSLRHFGKLAKGTARLADGNPVVFSRLPANHLDLIQSQTALRILLERGPSRFRAR